ncbi:transcriptional regulator GutM [Polycladomyces sp. WAk]|uniref:Transcriptional regulator GutM n=1 Tax=Polycladomyces zharkentensis TaxID=2807616 RepID=A0ABS2WHC1_9BACL|nr:transcriptional regulator GutM [Polycladomyces sp. WAk]MBN2908913.1 transcriptional regulator GutM [Polycladomyces sp. WAk]
MAGSILLMIGLSWAVQSVLGYLQIKHFNQRFRAMCKLGQVVVGRNTGRFRAGTVVLIAIDKNHSIIKAEKIQGVTVFSRLRSMKKLEGKNLLRLTDSDLREYDQLTAKAIQNAINNFKTVYKGGEALLNT